MLPVRGKRWQVRPAAPADFLAATPEYPLLAQVLYNRGLRSAEEVSAFLDDPDTVVENPYRLRDVELAVERIVQAIERQETICVYGDFDADGVAATTLLVTALQSAGGRVGPYIPDRVDEGYGLNVDALDQIGAKATLVVTVDCGIRSVAEVAHARRAGLDMIITDHHSIGDELPPAIAVINPQRVDSPPDFRRLAGVGVAYRLAQAVLRARLDADNAAEIETRLLDLVALGTVADMMPLLGQNRSLVRRGLVEINRTQRPGLQTLIRHADLRPGTVDATAIAFRIAPRINAAGRLAHARLAYQLLRTTDDVQAYTLTTELESLNSQRRALTDGANAEAERQLKANGDGDCALIVVKSPKIISGVVGLVAGKLVDRYYRPSVVVEVGDEESRGSARSIPEFNITQALDEVRDLLVRHGGHSRAAGFTVRTEKLETFVEALGSVAERELTERDGLLPTLEIDAEIDFDDINWTALEQLTRLEPTGYENPTPLLMCCAMRVRDVRTVGKGKHLRMVLDRDQGSAVVDAVGFGIGDRARDFAVGERVDAVFQIEANEWQGQRRLQLNLQDIRASQNERASG